MQLKPSVLLHVCDRAGLFNTLSRCLLACFVQVHLMIQMPLKFLFLSMKVEVNCEVTSVRQGGR